MRRRIAREKGSEVAKKLLKWLIRYAVQFECIQLVVGVKVKSRSRSNRLESYGVDLSDCGDDDSRLIGAFLGKSLAGKILGNVCSRGSNRDAFLKHFLDGLERGILGDQSFLAAA